MNDGPLVTFFIMAYNQEKFIREAVKGALAQTYSPLEIILSDDCSRDRTFDIMREEASSYGGPHSIILNRNERNLGIGGNINRIMKLAKGELVVLAAGDDISLPERTSVLCDAYRKSRGRAFSLYSDALIVDQYNRRMALHSCRQPEHVDMPWAIKSFTGSVTGCSHAWSRASFDLFGPILDETAFEDRVIAFRSFILGDIVHIPSPLVRWRHHPDNVSRISRRLSNHDLLKQAAELFSRYLTVLHNYRRDFDTARRKRLLRPHDVDVNCLSDMIDKQINLYTYKAAFASSNMFSRYHITIAALRTGVGTRQTMVWLLCTFFPWLYTFNLSRVIKSDWPGDSEAQ